jgi:hypothetical protein
LLTAEEDSLRQRLPDYLALRELCLVPRFVFEKKLATQVGPVFIPFVPARASKHVIDD